MLFGRENRENAQWSLPGRQSARAVDSIVPLPAARLFPKEYIHPCPYYYAWSNDKVCDYN